VSVQQCCGPKSAISRSTGNVKRGGGGGGGAIEAQMREYPEIKAKIKVHINKLTQINPSPGNGLFATFTSNGRGGE